MPLHHRALVRLPFEVLTDLLTLSKHPPCLFEILQQERSCKQMFTVRSRRTDEVLLTKSNNFPPIPTSPVAVEHRMSSSGAHFSCCNRSWVHMSPTAFDVLPMSTPDTRAIIERIFRVAAGPMGGEMELRDKILEGKLGFGELKFFGIGLDSLE